MTVNVKHEETTGHLTPGRPILVKNGARQRWCTFKFFHKRSTKHRKDRKMERSLHTQTHTQSQLVNSKMKQCYGIKGHTQAENLRQVGHI